jgi:hypothetical protein
MVPIARELADRGHTVAICNPSPAPARLIEETGLPNLPLPPLPAPAVPALTSGQFRDVEEFWANNRGMLDDAYARAITAAYVEVIEACGAEVVVDSFSPYACLAARALRRRLVTVLQGDFHRPAAGSSGGRPRRQHPARARQWR